MYADEDGNLAWFVLPLIIGGLAGAYGGGAMANGSANPGDWDFSSGKTWGYMLGGAAVGAGSGVLGAYVAGGTTVLPYTGLSIEYGLGAGTTAGLITGSTVNSLGMFALSGGQSDLTINLGFATIDVMNTEISWNNPFDDDPWYVNVGEALGWVSNLSDLNRAFPYPAAEGSCMKCSQKGLFKTNYMGSGGTERPCLPVDYADYGALQHDLAYQSLKIHTGWRGLFFDTRAISADYSFVNHQASVLSRFAKGLYDPFTLQTTSFSTASRAFGSGLGLGLMALPKTLSYNNFPLYAEIAF